MSKISFNVLIKAVDGREVRCRGSSTVTLTVEEIQFKMRMLVLEHSVSNIDVVISMAAIAKLGCVTIEQNCVKFSISKGAVVLY